MPEMEPSAIDQKIMRLATHRSPAEISEALNGVVTPEEVRNRLQTLTQDRNWLSLLQRQWLILENLSELTYTYNKYALDGHIKSADLVLRGLSEMRKMVEGMQTSLEGKMAEITDAQAIKMGNAITQALTVVILGLGADNKRANELMLEAMPVAMKEIEAEPAAARPGK